MQKTLSPIHLRSGVTKQKYRTCPEPVVFQCRNVSQRPPAFVVVPATAVTEKDNWDKSQGAKPSDRTVLHSRRTCTGVRDVKMASTVVCMYRSDFLSSSSATNMAWPEEEFKI